jgi:hypothetical protein
VLSIQRGKTSQAFRDAAEGVYKSSRITKARNLVRSKVIRKQLHERCLSQQVLHGCQTGDMKPNVQLPQSGRKPKSSNQKTTNFYNTTNSPWCSRALNVSASPKSRALIVHSGSCESPSTSSTDIYNKKNLTDRALNVSASPNSRALSVHFRRSEPMATRSTDSGAFDQPDAITLDLLQQYVDTISTNTTTPFHNTTNSTWFTRALYTSASPKSSSLSVPSGSCECTSTSSETSVMLDLSDATTFDLLQQYVDRMSTGS